MEIISAMEESARFNPIFDIITVDEVRMKHLLNFHDVYEYEGDLGAGTFGTVKSYRYRATGVIYALKEIRLRSWMTFNAFKCEVEIMKELSKQNDSILQYHDAFVYTLNGSSIYTIVTEYIEGFTLKTYIERLIESERVIDPKTLLNFSHWLFSTLSFMHEVGYAHRDIKPSNIMVDIKRRRFVLLDFGAGCRLKADSPDLDNFRKQLGTSHYMAPELWYHGVIERSFFGLIGSDISILKKTDIWAAGITIYHLVEKKIPWSSGDEIDLLRDEIIGPYELKMSSGSLVVRQILTMALVRDPGGRKTATEILTKIKEMIRRSTVRAPSESIKLRQLQ